ncbi:OmpH family outer membrane protein [bacterium]|nr:OmpH family outer membrane protein [bacterium]
MRIKLIIIAVLISIAGMAFPKEMKIAYFNSDELRKQWDDWKDAQAKFDQDVVNWQKQAQAMEDTITQMAEDYQRQELLLSEDKKQEKQMLLAQKQQEYQQFLSTIFGDGGQATQRNAELTSPLYDEISQALSKIAERDGIDVIFDAESSGIAYIDPSFDITDELLQELKSSK